MKWIKLFENFRKLNESVEESLEDIKWVLVDYDNIVPYDYYPNSTNLLVFRITGSGISENDRNRIERLANGEDWSVSSKREFLIFYKGTKEEAILNWLDENYNNLKIKVSKGEDQYYKENEYVISFTVNKTFNPNYELLYNNIFMESDISYIPHVFIGDANLLDDILKNWLERTYNITKITNIYYED
jgi:hypothetical protein